MYINCSICVILVYTGTTLWLSTWTRSFIYTATRNVRFLELV